MAALAALSQIPHLNALNILQATLQHTSPSISTYITPLDDLLLDLASSSSPLAPGSVLEIQGRSGSGKSALAAFMGMTTLLPPTLPLSLTRTVLGSGASAPTRTVQLHTGGRGKSVVLLDCTDSFSLARMHRMILTHLERCLAAALAEDGDEDTPPGAQPKWTPRPSLGELARDAMRRLHVFRPRNTAQLAATLVALQGYHEQEMREEEIGLLVVDGIGQFWHQDKAALDSLAALTHIYVPCSSPCSSPPPLPLPPPPLQSVLTALAHIRSTLSPLIVLTTQGLYPLPSPSPSDPPGLFAQHLPPPYPSPFRPPPNKPNTPSAPPSPLKLTHHISLQPVLPTAFPPGTMLEEAVRDEPSRREIVGRQRAVGVLRTPGEDGTSYSVGRFEFGIGEGGLEVE